MSEEDRRKLGRAGLLVEEVISKQQVKLESDLHDQIINLLNLRGIVYGHARMDKKSTYTVDWPDFTIAVQTRNGETLPVGIEAKGPDTVTTPEQLAMHERMRKNGWRIFVVHSALEFKLNMDSLILGSSVGK